MCTSLLAAATVVHVVCRRVLQVLPTVIPKLVAVPISPANARALAAVVDVTSSTIQSQFNVRDATVPLVECAPASEDVSIVAKTIWRQCSAHRLLALLCLP